jgi:chloride channel 3/4/5
LFVDEIHFTEGTFGLEDKICTFSKNYMLVSASNRVDMSATLEQAVIQLRKDVSQEMLVSMFQKLVSIRNTP